MDSMFMQLARLIDRLEEAGINPTSIAIRLTAYEDRKLCEEVHASCNLKGTTAHNGSFMGWRIVVEEDLS